MLRVPAKERAPGDTHYVVPMVLLCVLCLAAAFSAVLYAIVTRTDIDAINGRLTSLEHRLSNCYNVSSNQPFKKTDDNSPRLPENRAEGRQTSISLELNNGKSFGEESSDSPRSPTMPNQFNPADVWSVLLSPQVDDLQPNRESISTLPAALQNLPQEWEKYFDEIPDIEEVTKSDEETDSFSPNIFIKSPAWARLKRSPLNEEFGNAEFVNAEVEDTSRPDRRRGGGRRRGGAREDPAIRGGQRITGSTQTLALHFDGNTSKYSLGHRHYAGNGRLRHPDGIFKDWRMKEWGSHLSRQHRLQENDGTLTIRESGIYFVYAQVYYLDDHDINGFLVMVNESPVLQCTTMTHGAGHTKANTCFTGGLVELHAGDILLLRDVEALRYSVFEPEKSFFGLFRVAHHTAGQREGP